jgi:hypothetical protein
MLAVALLVVQGFVINRLAGIDYPLWAPRAPPLRDTAVAPGNATAPSSRLSNDAAPYGHGDSN